MTLIADSDADPLLRAHGRLRTETRAHVTVTALLAKIVADTVADHPSINTTLDGEEFVHHAQVNLGIAVALDTGDLTVPVLRRTNEKSLIEVASSIEELAARVRNGKLGLEDVRGGIVTLSSIGPTLPGVIGTPVLPPGQSAIVLVGGFTEMPVVRDGVVAAASLVRLSVTFDHRVVNGMDARAFMVELVRRIHDDPERLANDALRDSEAR